MSRSINKPKVGDVYYDAESDVLGVVDELMVGGYFNRVEVELGSLYVWLDPPWPKDLVYIGTL